MKIRYRMRAALTGNHLLLTSLLLWVASAAMAMDAGRQSGDADKGPGGAVPSMNPKTIEQAAGVDATSSDDGAVRVEWVRADVPVNVDGMNFPPAAGLGSWAAFKSTGDGAVMVMGDTVVFQDEVSPAMDAALAHGLDVTALHNHFLYDDPKVYFMHIGGHGNAAELAAGVKAVWDAIRQVRDENPMPAEGFGGPRPRGGRIDPKPIEQITGLTAAVNPSGVVKITAGREARMHDEAFGASMGLSTWAAFSGTNELAAIDGDFAMLADEVTPVLHALRRADIHVAALHNHMIGETPGYYFLHFWAVGPAAKLAEGFKAALDAQRGS